MEVEEEEEEETATIRGPNEGQTLERLRDEADVLGREGNLQREIKSSSSSQGERRFCEKSWTDILLL